MMKKVALFGGSFDPVHSGHFEIVLSLLATYDEVWIIVASSSPFKRLHYTSFDNRYEMCMLAFNSLENVSVLDVEKRMDFQYSYDVVKYLNDQYKYDFDFVIGADNIDGLKKWYRYEDLIKLVNFVVFTREGYEVSPSYLKVNNPISSTLSRVTKKTGIDKVNKYIADNSLYVSGFENDFLKLKGVVSEKRFNHTVFVYSLIIELAKIHNLDLNKCALAAIYHDYYKELATREFIDEYKDKNPQYSSFNNNIMHGVIAGELLDLDDDVLEAIKYHPCGKVNASNILKALYIADFCERSRKYFKEVTYILKMAYHDLNAAYIEAFNKRTKINFEKYGKNKELEKFIKGEELI